MLDLSANLTQGSLYAFYFTSNGLLGVLPSSDSVAAGLSGDSNFDSPSVFTGPKGLIVNFNYTGQGSTVGAAGQEMESVINSNRNIVSDSVSFDHAIEGSDTSSNPAGTNWLVWILAAALVFALGWIVLETDILKGEK